MRFKPEDYQHVLAQIEALEASDEREHPDNLIILSALRLASRADRKQIFDLLSPFLGKAVADFHTAAPSSI